MGGITEILIVTVKNYPELNALFVNGTMVYRTFETYHPSIHEPTQAMSSAVAYQLLKALGLPRTALRSVNLPYEGPMQLDGRTYEKAKRYLQYRDASTARKKLRDEADKVEVYDFMIFDTALPADEIPAFCHAVEFLK
jgi:hypothetical protein